MANEIIYADFLRGVKNPKVTWVMDRLNELGIPNRIHGESIKGPVLQIERGRETLAMDVINRIIGELQIGVVNRTITISDLPDNHVIFEDTTPAFVSVSPIDDINVHVNQTMLAPEEPEYLKTRLDELPKLADRPIQKVPVDVPTKHKPKMYGTQHEGPVLAVSDKPAPAEIKPENDEWDDDDWGDDPVPTVETIVQKADRVLQWSDVVTMIDPAKSFTVRMYEINSSHMSSMGACLMFAGQEGQSLWVFVAFKGGKFHYRYYPVTQDQWEELLVEAINNQTVDKKLSVGQEFWRLLRHPAEAGKIVCERYDDHGIWTSVAPLDPKVLQERKDK